jgi:hypothetical protein
MARVDGRSPLPGAPPDRGRVALVRVATCNEQWVALLAWAAAALKCGPRDAWTGWTPALKFRRLHLIANNVRLLMLPDAPVRISPRKC